MDLVTFTEEILNGKLHFLCIERASEFDWFLMIVVIHASAPQRSMERINESKSLSLVILEPRTNFRTFWELEWPKNQMTRRVVKGETKSGNNIMNTIYVPKSERYSWIRVTRATLLKKATTNLHQYIHYSPRLPSPICRLP